MKTRIASICLLACAWALVCGPAIAQIDTITVLHLNDTHSNLAPLAPRDAQGKATRGGIARAATIIGLGKLQNPDALVLHAGDLFIGDPMFSTTFGVAELKLLNQFGLDAMAVGNHEFDLTPMILQTALDSAQVAFPLLSANCILDDPAVQSLKQHIKPYTIKQVKNRKIGVFGLTTPKTNLLSLPAPAFIDTLILETAALMVDTLRAQGCSVVILLSHLGLQLDQLVATYVPGIDAIVGGHDHDSMKQAVLVTNPLGAQVPIVQAGAFYEMIGNLRLVVDAGGVRLLDWTPVELNEQVPEFPLVAGIVDQLIADLETVYGLLFTQLIAVATADFREVADSLLSIGNHDTPVGNLVTDAFRAATGTDIAIQAGGSTAQPLYRGPIVPADIFRMLGYGFNLVNGLGYRIASFTLTGMEILGGLEWGLSQIDLNDEFLIQVSGMKYEYDPTLGPMNRLTGATVGGQPLDPMKTYSVTANEFALAFLGFIGLNPTNVVLQDSVTEFQVVTDYVLQRMMISPEVEGRVAARIKTSVEDRSSTMPGDVRLTAYPNPSRGKTDVRFVLPQPAMVNIVVFDALGREVRTLTNERYNVGAHSLALSGLALHSGMYHCIATVNGTRVTTSFMVVR